MNAGLLTLCACLVYYKAGAKMTGAAVACLFLVLGFALFGKNLLNVWRIVIGVVLYSRFKGETFATHINTAFFGVALAPIFSEILFSTSHPAGLQPAARASPPASSSGSSCAPAAAQLFKAHMGFCLYNMGFTAGLVGTLIVALYKSYGFVPDPVFIWTTGNNVLLGAFLTVVFVSMIALGFYLDRGCPAGMKKLMDTSGQSPSDFIALVGFGPTLANMGMTGAIGMAYILAVGGELNGPVIGAIFTIVGFAAFGEHPRNIVPIMAGVFLGFAGEAVERGRSVDPARRAVRDDARRRSPGRFGWHWGVVAGFVHSSAALTRRPAACRPQPVQQRLRRRHRRRRARAGHHRHPVQNEARRSGGERRQVARAIVDATASRAVRSAGARTDVFLAAATRDE